MKHFFLILICIACLPRNSLSQTREWKESEKQLKAAMLLNFLRFTEYPQQPTQYELCVLGTNPFDRALKSLEKNTVRDLKLITKVLSFNNADLSECELLFISSTLEDKTIQVLNRLKDKSTLTVAEMESFARKGGMINIINAGSTVRFRINNQEAKRHGLKISSRLLRIATVVETRLR